MKVDYTLHMSSRRCFVQVHILLMIGSYHSIIVLVIMVMVVTKKGIVILIRVEITLDT